MARPNGRAQRVADFLRKELSSLILLELRDPRVGMVSITDVELSKDLAHAKIFVTVLGCDSVEEAEQSLTVLNQAAGFLRTEISRQSKMRSMPSFRFIFDDSVQRGHRMSMLIAQALESDQRLSEKNTDNGEA